MQKGVQCDALIIVAGIMVIVAGIMVIVAGTQGIEQSQARGWVVAKRGLARHGVCNSKGPTNVTGSRLWNVYRCCNRDAS